jgi:hypothetical protein
MPRRVGRRTPRPGGVITDLVSHVAVLRPYTPPRPYWAGRQVGVTPPTPPDPAAAPERFTDLIRHLSANGYLDRDFSEPCVLSDPDKHYGRDLDSELRQRLGHPGPGRLWPLRPDTWDSDTFYSLIEIFHDLVARPRGRWDDHDDCGPHFHDFETEAGRRVYRVLVNRLLEEHGVELRLAIDGEDEGRLVHTVDEARTDLINQALAPDTSNVAARVRHAIAQFRGRVATEHDKRSAVLTLVGVLEERRELVRTEIGRKDEGALFTLANEFAIRHQRRGQQGDYDPAFLDWMFWWYLATVELTDRILDRAAAQPVGAPTTP